ncbi:hypothetical protein N7457_006637 [Penicillium paradoxum]|uniref:uncharacterized protein n=1 Tax=Penicillium paradoxum TaxID=176176 RepID=UPI002546CAC8|nr:uncharacterized protein N7457_006637 [Penicillium paradoxum]KAJ5778917.1 hypothetical protein N7457_006637 [Penicillium paradoxum]
MRFDIFTVLAFAGLAMAAKTIPSGEKCKKDGSMGNCESKVCIVRPQIPWIYHKMANPTLQQPAKANIGKCK